MITWVAVSIVVGIVGLGIIAAGGRRLCCGHPLRGVGGIVSGSAIALIGLAIGLVGAHLHTYARLNYEWPIAEVSVRELDRAQKRYELTIRPLDGTYRSSTCELLGDEWLLSARVQKWKPWANLIGFDATYSLEQVGNKYFLASEANGKPITACDIERPQSSMNRIVPGSWQAWLMSRLQTDDRRFGSANYMPLVEGAAYIVFMTQAGLNAEPVNEAAGAANNARP